MEEAKRIAFTLRVIHNQIKLVLHKSAPENRIGPRTQLQGGILGYLYHHGDQPVYQRDLEKEFRISRATATNTLQVMEREGLIVRKAQDKDGRLKRIQMTQESYQNHKAFESHMDWMGRQLLAGMSEAEVTELFRLLGIMMKNLEELAARDYESPGGNGKESGEEPPVSTAKAEEAKNREGPERPGKVREGPADAEAKREQENGIPGKPCES